MQGVGASCFDQTVSTASCINTVYNDGWSLQGLEDSFSCAGTAVGTYASCVSSWRGNLNTIPADAANHLKKVSKDISNVAPKFVENLSIKTFETGAKQYLYKGIDFTHHVHSLMGAFQAGKMASGDNFYSYGVAMGNLLQFLSSTEVSALQSE